MHHTGGQMTDKPKRRIVVPQKTNQIEQSDVVVVPETGRLINDAKAIIGAELAQYRSKTKRGVTLDLKEARVITGYLDALTRAQKEEREQARADDFSDLSDSELLQLATQLAKTAPGAAALERPNPASKASEPVRDSDAAQADEDALESNSELNKPH